MGNALMPSQIKWKSLQNERAPDVHAGLRPTL